jgi:hypothetical protein
VQSADTLRGKEDGACGATRDSDDIFGKGIVQTFEQGKFGIRITTAI